MKKMPPKRGRPRGSKNSVKKTPAKAHKRIKEKVWRKPAAFRGTPRNSGASTPLADGSSLDESSRAGRSASLTSRAFIHEVLRYDAASESSAEGECMDDDYSSDIDGSRKAYDDRDDEDLDDDQQDDDDEFVPSESELSDSNLSFTTAQSSEQVQSVYEPLAEIDTEQIPQLTLPPSSEDLLVPRGKVLQTMGIYEVLRTYRRVLRLSLFSFEDFAAALVVEEQNTLMHEIHSSLLRTLLREEENNQTTFGPPDVKDSINVLLFFLDGMTYPAVVREYLRSDGPAEFTAALKAISSPDYPVRTLDDKLCVLQMLTDIFLTSNSVREELMTDGFIKYDDHCRACQKTGDVLCCDSCPAVYHMECIDPPLETPPEGEWFCSFCIDSEVDGVSDCISSTEVRGMSRHDPLGYDRHRRKYWFLERRIIIEADDGEMWIISTEKQLEELLLCLDSDKWEKTLVSRINARKEEIIAHMVMTQRLTKENKGSRKAYLDMENERINALQTDRTANNMGVKAEVKVENEVVDTAKVNVEVPGAEETIQHEIDCASESSDIPIKEEESALQNLEASDGAKNTHHEIDASRDMKEELDLECHPNDPHDLFEDDIAESEDVSKSLADSLGFYENDANVIDTKGSDIFSGSLSFGDLSDHDSSVASASGEHDSLSGVKDLNSVDTIEDLPEDKLSQCDRNQSSDTLCSDDELNDKLYGRDQSDNRSSGDNQLDDKLIGVDQQSKNKPLGGDQTAVRDDNHITSDIKFDAPNESGDAAALIASAMPLPKQTIAVAPYIPPTAIQLPSSQTPVVPVKTTTSTSRPGILKIISATSLQSGKPAVTVSHLGPEQPGTSVTPVSLGNKEPTQKFTIIGGGITGKPYQIVKSLPRVVQPQSALSVGSSLPIQRQDTDKILTKTEDDGKVVSTLKSTQQKVILVNKDGSKSTITLPAQSLQKVISVLPQNIDTAIKLSVDPDSESTKYITRSRTGNLAPKRFTDSVADIKGGVRMITQFKAEQEIRHKQHKLEERKLKVLTKGVDSKLQATNITLKEEVKAPVEVKVVEPYKLGMEGGYKSYINYYTENPLALSKTQQQEEKEKRRHLSYKFSLTTASEFKWVGSVYGPMFTIVATLRATFLQLEESLPHCFLHHNWPHYRQHWIKALQSSSRPSDFGTVLAVLEGNIKPVLFNVSWTESLGHVTLKRQTEQDREELKKKEKVDRRRHELDDHSSQGGLATWIRYTKGPKHQVHKLKGEEYRLSTATGNGWQWCRATRQYRHVPYDTVGLRKIARQMRESPAVQDTKLTPIGSAEKTDVDLTQTLSSERLLVDLEKYRSMRPDLVDVSNGLTNYDLYPKVATPPSKLSKLLTIRQSLQLHEQEQHEAFKRLQAKRVTSESKHTAQENPEGKCFYTHCYSALCGSAEQPTSRCYSALCNLGLADRAPVAALEGAPAEADSTDIDIENDDAAHVSQFRVTLAKEGKSTKITEDELETMRKQLPPEERKTRDPLSLNQAIKLFSSKKPKTGSKKPDLHPIHKYKSRSGKPNLFIIASFELRAIARRGGRREATGYNYNTKNVPQRYWPYPAPRPRLKTCWEYRLHHYMTSLHDVASYLRILWASLRWDDMATKAPSGGTNTQSTENEITTRELIDKKNVPPTLLRSEYRVKTIVIPLNLMEQPSRPDISEPIRSGLRKRKKAEVQAPAQPTQTIQWIPEEALELWEIKYFAEKTVQRKLNSSSALKPVLKTPVPLKPESPSSSTVTLSMNTLKLPQNSLELSTVKAQIEEQLKAQRLAAQQKRLGTATATSLFVTKPPSQTLQTMQTLVSKVQANTVTSSVQHTSAGQTVSLMPSIAGQIIRPKTITIMQQGAMKTITTPHVVSQAASTGQTILRPNTPGSTIQLLPRQTSPSAGIITGSTPSSTAGNTSQTLVIKTSNGQDIHIRGLQSHQQLVRLPDGNITIVDKSQIKFAPSPRPGVPGRPLIQLTPKAGVSGSSSPAGVIIVSTSSASNSTALSAPATAKLITSVSSSTAASQSLVLAAAGALAGKGNLLVKAPVSTSSSAVLSLVTSSAAGATGTGTQLLVKTVPALSTAASQGTLKTSVNPNMVTVMTSVGLTTPIKTGTSLITATPKISKMLETSSYTPSSTTASPDVTSNKPSTTVAAITVTSGTPAATRAVVSESISPSDSDTMADDQSSRSTVTESDSLSTTLMQQVVAQALMQNPAPDVQSKLVAMQRKLSTVKGAIPLQMASSETIKAIPKAPLAATLEITEPTEEEIARLKEKKQKNSEEYKRRKERETNKKLATVLERHKNLLKKEIRKKKHHLDDVLRSELLHEIEETSAQDSLNILNSVAEYYPNDHGSALGDTECLPAQPYEALPTHVPKLPKVKRKRKLSETLELGTDSGHDAPTVSKIAKTISSKSKPPAHKMRCICNTSYDPTKFYVACDICESYFHGSCVGISSKAVHSQTITSYICKSCKKLQKESSQELYCLCRRPYNEAQFYVGCDECEDWFHPDCVGISQIDAEAMDTYVCPNCKSSARAANAQVKVSATVLMALKKLVKSLQAHEMAWPFQKPVNPKEVPDYYDIIKDPMDLETLSAKLKAESYKTVADFAKDAAKIFNNCRYYNAAGSPIFQCAEILEKIFVQKLKEVKSSLKK